MNNLIDKRILCLVILESGCLGMQPKLGGKSHLKLNIGKRPIANKYREGKMKRTLKRELKVLEIVNREPLKFQSL